MTARSASRTTGALSFSGHESFVCRYGWLKKALDEVLRDPECFSAEDAMVRLGVGKNMVRSIRHWGLATRILEEIPNTRGMKLRPSILGAFLLGEGGMDQYLEDASSQWLVHWNLATNERRATTWVWAFSLLRAQEFNRDGILTTIQDELKRRDLQPGNEHSLRRDIDCFLRTYTSGRKPTLISEDSLECPLTELDLLQHDNTANIFMFKVGFHSTLSMDVFAYALLEYWNERASARETMPFSEIAYGYGSPGMVFKLDESSLTERLERLDEVTDGRLAYTDTAGIKQVYRQAGMPSPMNLLQQYYASADAQQYMEA